MLRKKKTSETTRSGFRDTALYHSLESIRTTEGNSVRLTLESRLPDIERILESASTSPTDFTLHDAEHSHRVAKRMAELIPSDVLPKLSTYELALLLLSAYLHDIGMTPQQRKVTLHFQYLLTGERDGLNPAEVQGFQQFVDDQGGGLALPLCKGTPTPDDLKRAMRLVAFYCRFKHNDWSEEWIRQNLGHDKLGAYASCERISSLSVEATTSDTPN